jgi:integrase
MKGHIRERSPGSYEIRYSWKDPATGKRKTATATVRGTPKDAQRALRKRLAALDEGRHVDPSRLTVKDWLTMWLATIEAEVSPKTHERYGEYVKHFLIPELGALLLQKLTSVNIQAAYTKWSVEGRRDGKPGGLAPQTRRHIHRVLSSALARATEQEPPLLARNPAGAFRKRGLLRVERREVEVLNPQQAIDLLEGLRHTRMYWPVLIALATGCRRGEALALRWGRINLDTGTALIVESLEQTKAGLRFKSTKSEKARSITMPAFAVAELRRHKTEQAQELLAIGIRQGDGTLVCRRANPFNRDGNLDKDAAIPPRSCSHEFSRLVRGIKGLPKISLHKLRHSHASMLIAAGENLKTIQERLGHSSIAVTIDLYGHLAEDAQGSAAARLDTAFAAIRPK